MLGSAVGGVVTLLFVVTYETLFAFCMLLIAFAALFMNRK